MVGVISFIICGYANENFFGDFSVFFLKHLVHLGNGLVTVWGPALVTCGIFEVSGEIIDFSTFLLLGECLAACGTKLLNVKDFGSRGLFPVKY